MSTAFQARFLLAPADALALADLTSKDFRHRRDLPDVVAPSAQEAAELASQWYGEAEVVAAVPRASVCLEPRVVEVRAVDPQGHLVPGEWQRFLVSKRLVVERKAEPLGALPADWLDALKAAWAWLDLHPMRKLEDVTAFDSWDGQGLVRFVVRLVESKPLLSEVQFTARSSLATRVARALLPHFIAHRGNDDPTVDGARAASEGRKAFEALNLTAVEARKLMGAAGRESA